MAEQTDNQSCGACRYFRRFDAAPDRGWCRRFPPLLQRSYAADYADDGTFPDVNESLWCGEFAPANPDRIDDAMLTLAKFVLLGDKTAARALADKLRED